MKVLYFHQHFSTPAGAAGNRSYWMARHLVDRGHSVTMICGSYGLGSTGLCGGFARGRRHGFVDGIEIIEFDMSYSNADSFLRRAVTFSRFGLRSIKVALTLDYDVIFATSTPLTAGLPGIAARWLRRKRFVFEVRDLWPELPRSMGVITNPIVLGAMSVLEFVSYRSAHRLIALAPGIADGIISRGVQARNVIEIPNGCDLDVFGNMSDASRPLMVSPGDLCVVYTGTHGIANGLDAVLDAARVLEERGRADIKLVLIGDGKLKNKLQDRAKRETLNNVLFYPPVSKAQLARILSAADLGLQILANIRAFSFGTSPNKFFDYIAAGLPVLNNYPGWVADLIHSHDCGFVVCPDDPAAFADALELAASDRRRLRNMGTNARALAEKQFDRRQLAAQFADWLEGSAHA